MKTRLLVVFAWVLFLALSSLFVSAENVLDDALKNIADLDIPEKYRENYILIDLLIYLMIFGGALNSTIKEKFGGLAVFGMTVAFTLAMLIFEYTNDFRLGDFWIFALFLAILVIAVNVYKSFKEAGDHKDFGLVAISIMYIVLYVAFSSTMPKTAFHFEYDFPLLFLFLRILLVLAISFLVFRVFNFLKKEKDEGALHGMNYRRFR